MKKILYVGDLHVVPEELDDCWALIRFVMRVAKEQWVDAVCFLGDQTHTHALIRVEVLAFWLEVVKMFQAEGIPLMMLVGNHDRPGTIGSKLHSMMVYEHLCTVIDEPRVIDDVLYVPYMDTPEQVVEVCQKYPTFVAVCHQTFEGSKYENGIYAKDGVSLDQIPQRLVISGHIHTPQRYGGRCEVWYVGAPRWRTLSDANVQRAIWVVEHDDQGGVVGTSSFDTGEHCRQIRSAVDTPEEPVDPETLDRRHDWRIDIKGPTAWVEERKTLLAGPGVKLRTFKVDERKVKLRESDGVTVAFDKHLGRYAPRHGTEVQVLQDLVKNRMAEAQERGE